MQQYLKKSLVIFFFLVTLVCLYTSTNAYVLSGAHILELMTQNFGKTKSLLVAQTLVLHNDSSQNNGAELSETLRYIFPQMFRSDVLSENVHRIHILSQGEILTVIDKKVTDESVNRYDRYKDILLFRSREILQDKLSLNGLDLTVSSLGRFQGKPAYVLGAQYPDEMSSQIWLDKNTFRPFRWIITSRAVQDYEDSMEVRYQEWRQVSNAWYPMHIEFLTNGVLVREINVQTIKVNPSFPDELFDIEHLKSIYPQVAQAVPDQGKTEGLDEVQKTIEDFKKLYE